MAAGEVIIRDLGEGLVLRRAREDDVAALAAFNANIHRPREATEPDPRFGDWTLDLAFGSHPTCSFDLFTVVEDMRAGKIVSTLNLIPQTWTYAGIPFAVGLIELVGTLPEYRNRGLVRAQMEVAHRWSVDLGHVVQVIGGIPFFYRQFGYEMAIALNGMRLGPKHEVPALKAGEAELFRVRPAGEDDVSFITATYRHATSRYLVASVREEEMWRYEMFGRRPGSMMKQDLCIVETLPGEPLGFLAHFPRLVPEYGRTLFATQYELKPGTSWAAVTPAVLRYLRGFGDSSLAADDKDGFFNLGLWLGDGHPCYDVLYRRFETRRPDYAWYVRVADLPGFLRLIAPALERRLASSVLAGHTGELHLSFYRSGLRLALEGGRVVAVEPWQPTPEEEGDVSFPGLTFLQFLFGYRSLDELRYAFADCVVWDKEAKPLVEALFPKQTSDVWQIV